LFDILRLVKVQEPYEDVKGVIKLLAVSYFNGILILSVNASNIPRHIVK